MRIRPLDTSRDFPALAALLAACDPEPPTPELLREWEGNAPVGLVRQRLVACDPVDSDAANSEALIGFCDAVSWPWELPHQFWISTVVAPDHRRRGAEQAAGRGRARIRAGTGSDATCGRGA